MTSNIHEDQELEQESLLAGIADEIDATEAEEENVPVREIRTKPQIALEVFEFLEMLVLAACAIIFLFSFVARLSTVDGSSMLGTLEHGDKLIVSDLFYTPKQGDIVVFQDAGNKEYPSAIVKRVIATEGQTVVLQYKQNGNRNELTVTVDGVVLDETDYRYYDTSLPKEFIFRYDGTATYTVPEDCVFVLGDNTYNSEDSRGSFGYVEEDEILGRVVFRVCGEKFSSLFSKFGTVA